MPRYLCICYTAKQLAKVNKDTKKVIVIDTSDPNVLSTVESELKNNRGFKYIRYIRNLDSTSIHYNDNKLKKTEIANNYQLKLKSHL